MAEEGKSGYLSRDLTAAFFRSLAIQFPEVLDVLCLSAQEEHELYQIRKLRGAIHSLCLCVLWASTQVRLDIIHRSPTYP